MSKNITVNGGSNPIRVRYEKIGKVFPNAGVATFNPGAQIPEKFLPLVSAVDKKHLKQISAPKPAAEEAE